MFYLLIQIEEISTTRNNTAHVAVCHPEKLCNSIQMYVGSIVFLQSQPGIDPKFGHVDAIVSSVELGEEYAQYQLQQGHL